MAKDEILQYFALRANAPPKSVQKALFDKITRDHRVVELIDVIDKVSGIIYQNKYSPSCSSFPLPLPSHLIETLKPSSSL